MYSSKQIKKVSSILKKNKTNYWTGIEGKSFEKEFSHYHNTKYSVAVSNGSVALEIALKALNLKRKNKVIVTPRSFVISASCVLNLGFKPIFADIDQNGNISIDGIKKVFNKSVKAIIIVHLNGMPCDMDPIIKFVKKHKVFLIEDCSQAHGAVYKGRKIGSFGDVATWSFCQDKIISTGGEGGMISTNNKKLYYKMWSLKDHGKNFNIIKSKKKTLGFRWLCDDLGSNYRMTEMQAAIGREQLKSLNRNIKKRNFIANLYLRSFKKYFSKNKLIKKFNLKCNSCPQKLSRQKCHECLNAFYRINFYLNRDKDKTIQLIKKLNANKINCGPGSCPEIYKEKVFKKFKIYPKNKLVNAKLLGETSLTFPIDINKSVQKYKSEIQLIKKILDIYL